MEVTARAERSGDWWAVEVHEVPGAVTQAATLEEVPEMVADVVALMVDGVDPADVQVTVLVR